VPADGTADRRPAVIQALDKAGVVARSVDRDAGRLDDAFRLLTTSPGTSQGGAVG
jgi:hypothetical protein